MKRPARRTLAQLIATTVVLAAACGDRQLLTPTSPSLSTVTPSRLGVEEGSSVFGAADAGPLAALSIDPSVFKGGENTRGTVTLGAPAPTGGMTVALTSDDTAATVPSSVTVAQGGTQAAFTIATRVTASDVRIRITASAGGGSLTALMRITPENGIAALDVSPSRIVSGTTATGTVTLASTSPAGGRVVQLSASNNDARLPSSITIAAGAKTGTFTVEAADVSSDTETRITASIGRDQRDAQVRILPARSGAASGTVTIGGVVE